MLGVLGGMGPVATIDFMKKVICNTPATRDQDHVPMFVRLAANIPDRTAAILDGGEDPLPALRLALQELARAGVSMIAMPCNTAHFWHDALQAQSSIPIFHIVDATLDTLPSGMDRVGVLATAGTLKAEIYQKAMAKRGVRCILPSDSGQLEVMRAIRLVKAGETHQATSILARQAEKLLDASCGSVVMACTEIPIALEETDLAPKLIDPTDALAKAVVRAWLNERLEEAA